MRIRDGCWMAVCAVLLLQSRAGGQQGAEFMTIESVNRLTVLNRYQQTASAAERRVLEPFAPLRVLRNDMLLSDGFTRAVHVEAGGEDLFLVRDQEGRLTERTAPGAVHTFSDVVLLGDTVVILTGGSVRFLPISSPPEIIPSGTHLLRFFAYDGRDYCRAIGRSPGFGWVALSREDEGKTWAGVSMTIARVPAAVPRDAARRIREKISGVNRALQSLYDRFGLETGKMEPVPQWQVIDNGAGLVCKLTGTAEPEVFRESTASLARDVENILLGSGAQVKEEPGVISVSVR